MEREGVEPTATDHSDFYRTFLYVSRRRACRVIHLGEYYSAQRQGLVQAVFDAFVVTRRRKRDHALVIDFLGDLDDKANGSKAHLLKRAMNLAKKEQRKVEALVAQHDNEMLALYAGNGFKITKYPVNRRAKTDATGHERKRVPLLRATLPPPL